MREGQRGVCARHGARAGGGEVLLQRTLHRFENAALNDTIGRVARDPRRKLGADDRLIGAARLAVAAGATPVQLPLVIAAALRFSDPLDPGSAELSHDIEMAGVEDVITSLCGLDPAQEPGRSVLQSWRRLTCGWAEGNPLLSLQNLMWAWCSDPPQIPFG
jgi:mannitol-1-phosphate 5-dehydrogenase